MTGTTMKVSSPAKVNLTFEILGTREDGYHEVRTLLCAISLFDELVFTITEAREPEIVISLSPDSHESFAKDFPLGTDNLIARAIRLYLSHNPHKKPLKIEVMVTKRIPMQAGLAGGSADGAAALRAMNDFATNSLDEDELLALAAKLGADMPFSLSGGLKIGSSRGDILESLPLTTEAPRFPALIIAKPRHLAISTPWAFKAYDAAADKIGLSEKTRDKGLTDDATLYAADLLLEGRWEEAIKAFGNDFEQVIFPEYQELKDIRADFMALGARMVNMTGSGPTMYAIVDSLQAAQEMIEAYKEKQRIDCHACVNKFDPLDLFAVEIIESGAFVNAVKNELKQDDC